MNIRRAFVEALAALAALLGAAASHAAEMMAFTPQAFEAAQKAGSPILIDIWAPWCPTCKAQKPILGALTADPKFKDLKVFEVDFDHQKDVVRGFKAQMQSTLIAFKGAQETARSVGDTKQESIAGLLDKAI